MVAINPSACIIARHRVPNVCGAERVRSRRGARDRWNEVSGARMRTFLHGHSTAVAVRTSRVDGTARMRASVGDSVQVRVEEGAASSPGWGATRAAGNRGQRRQQQPAENGEDAELQG